MENLIFCQSCGMPLQEDDFGTNADGSKSEDYCAYCYTEGDFTTEMTLEKMVETNLQYLDHYRDKSGKVYTEDEARGILTEWMLTLKRWKT